MTGDACVLCGNSRQKQPQLSYHRFPSNPEKRALWLRIFQLTEDQLKPSWRVCSRHFRGGDPRNTPDAYIGKRFASPVKKGDPRTKRAKLRQQSKDTEDALTAGSSAVTPLPMPLSPPPASPSPPPPTVPPLIALPGEQLEENYKVHELPSEINEGIEGTGTTGSSRSEEDMVSTTLIQRIEALEADNARLKSMLDKEKKQKDFGIEQIKHDDKLMVFYTGFKSYAIFLAFFHFLGPAVNNLKYWGMKARTGARCAMKLGPMDQLLMTLMKLKILDLSCRFNVSPMTASRYVTTWICFLYHHFKEINWMPSVQQVVGTLPPAFREQFPTTYAIIDASEIFMETPTDLHMQSSTWSSYKHHNTAKFLISCTPNGCTSFVSPLYVGSISDVELTWVCGFLTCLQGKPGISIMADRGFTIKDRLKDIGVDLNIPPFMEGRQQLPAKELKDGRRIASLRIHVERAIGRIKAYSILNQSLPISLARLSNQIVFVCAYLSNFKPVLVPSESLLQTQSEAEADDYFAALSDCVSSNEECVNID